MRYLSAEGICLLMGRSFPYGILTVNIAGSFLIGFLSILIIHKLELGPLWRTGILVGFLGGFTTFSSFSLDTYALLVEGFYTKAFLYITLSVVLCVSATAVGVLLAHKAFA
jgi:CrcB protein